MFGFHNFLESRSNFLGYRFLYDEKNYLNLIKFSDYLSSKSIPFTYKSIHLLHDWQVVKGSQDPSLHQLFRTNWIISNQKEQLPNSFATFSPCLTHQLSLHVNHGSILEVKTKERCSCCNYCTQLSF